MARVIIKYRATFGLPLLYCIVLVTGIRVRYENIKNFHNKYGPRLPSKRSKENEANVSEE